MAYRKDVGGRRIAVPKQIRTARDMMRRHLREENLLIKDFSQFMGFKSPTNVYDYFYRTKRPLPIQIVDAFCEFVKLDEFDALELRLQAAIDAGWQLEALKKAAV